MSPGQYYPWTCHTKKGPSWSILLGFVVLFSVANAISNKPFENPRRGSHRLRSGHVNFNHGPFNANYNERINSDFNHPQRLRRLLPNGNNPYHNNNDLSTAAQTLYDLRGFHIPIANKEETQRFLRQQNQLQADHQTTPLVFPSFFQPQQQRHEAQPQAINIFGHNQHHQQTHRFQSLENDNSFRPSQPDLGVTTTTENVFRPIQPTVAQLQNDKDRPTAETQPDIEEVYVYDDADYSLEQEQPVENAKLRQPKISNSGTNHITVEPSTVAPEVHNENRFGELIPPPHNRFVNKEKPQQNNFDFFDSQNENDITSPATRPSPNVEIVPSSERRPPELLVDTISQPPAPIPLDRFGFQQNDRQKSTFPLRVNRPTNIFPVQQFPIVQELPRIFQNPQQQFRENLNTNDFQRNRRPPQQLLADQNRQRHKDPLLEVPRDDNNENFFQNDPIIIQQLNSFINQDRFRPPQRHHLVNTLNTQVYLENPVPTQFHDEEKSEETEATTTAAPRRTTTTTTTEIPLPKKSDLKYIRPFSIRTRVPSLTSSTTTTSTTTAPRRTMRPRLTTSLATTTTTTASPPEIKSDYDEPEGLDTPRFIAAKDKITSAAPRPASQLVRTRTTEQPVVVVKLKDSPLKSKPQIPFQRERQLNYQESSASRELDNLPRNSPAIRFEPPPVPRPNHSFHDSRFQNQYEQPVHIFNDRYQPQFPIHQERQVQPVRFNQNLNQARFRQELPASPPQPTFSGKPLYINGKMLGKEGGLYAGQPIPPGHSYGNPIPHLPINSVFDRIPSILEGQVVSQPRRVQGPLIRQRQTTVRPSSTPTAENNRVSSRQQKTLVSNEQEKEEKSKSSSNTAQAQRARSRPPFRRKLRPDSERQQIAPSAKPLRERGSVKPTVPISEADSEVSLNINEVLPSTPPRVIRRRKRPRIFSTQPPLITETDEGIISRSSTQSPKIRPRIRLRKRPAPLNAQPSGSSEATASPIITQSSVQIFRKPTEAPGRFSSRYRDDESSFTTPIPTSPSITQTVTNQPVTTVERQKTVIKVPKAKVDSTTSKTTSRTFQPVNKPNAKPRPKDSEEGALPASIYLSPKDVLTNRKPARRIPPGSYSDRIKALQARRKNNKLRGTPARAYPLKPQNNSDEDDDEVDSQSSNIEQVQNKREIHHSLRQLRPTLKPKNNVKGVVPDLSVDFLQNSTQPSSEETLSLLGIQKPNNANSQLYPLLISLEDDTDGENQETTSEANIDTHSESEREANGNTFSGKQFKNELKDSTKSPFKLFTMSTEEPSLPLEAYFPIVSS